MKKFFVILVIFTAATTNAQVAANLDSATRKVVMQYAAARFPYNPTILSTNSQYLVISDPNDKSLRDYVVMGMDPQTGAFAPTGHKHNFSRGERVYAFQGEIYFSESFGALLVKVPQPEQPKAEKKKVTADQVMGAVYNVVGVLQNTGVIPDRRFGFGGGGGGFNNPTGTMTGMP